MRLASDKCNGRHAQAALLPAVTLAFPVDPAAKKGTTIQEQAITTAVLGALQPSGCKVVPRLPGQLRCQAVASNECEQSIAEVSPEHGTSVAQGRHWRQQCWCQMSNSFSG